MQKHLFVVLALVLVALACNWSDIAPPAAPVINPSPLPTFAINTLTAVPTETPLPTATSTPEAPIAWPKDQSVNCRYGPGVEWETVSSLPADSMTEIKGRTINTAWWYVSDPMSLDGFCWVAYDVVDTAGNLDIVPIVEPPVASVTDVSVEAVVAFSACGADNQVTFSGTITANGPAAVTYHWEVDGDVQSVTLDETVQFAESGTKNVKHESFSTDCGDYTLKLVITSPNDLSTEKVFKVQAQ